MDPIVPMRLLPQTRACTHHYQRTIHYKRTRLLFVTFRVLECRPGLGRALAGTVAVPSIAQARHVRHEGGKSLRLR